MNRKKCIVMRLIFSRALVGRYAFKCYFRKDITVYYNDSHPIEEHRNFNGNNALIYPVCIIKTIRRINKYQEFHKWSIKFKICYYHMEEYHHFNENTSLIYSLCRNKIWIIWVLYQNNEFEKSFATDKLHSKTVTHTLKNITISMKIFYWVYLLCNNKNLNDNNLITN